MSMLLSPAHLTALREGQSTLSQAAQPLGECAASSEPLTSLYRPMMAVTLLRGTSIFYSDSEMPMVSHFVTRMSSGCWSSGQSP